MRLCFLCACVSVSGMHPNHTEAGYMLMTLYFLMLHFELIKCPLSKRKSTRDNSTKHVNVAYCPPLLHLFFEMSCFALACVCQLLSPLNHRAQTTRQMRDMLTSFPTTDTHIVEAIAMIHGIILANSLGFHAVQIEANSMEVINACAGQDTTWSETTTVYLECFSTKGMIGSVDFLHCIRKANEVAHVLAKFAYDNKLACNWVDEPPDFLIATLTNNVTILPNQ